jgi:alpha-L-fucosidase
MRLNGDAIFGTRPWRSFGEGPTPVKAGNFSEGSASEFIADDFRFTQKGETLFAIALGRPASAALTVKSLRSATPGSVERVELLATGAKLSFARDAAGLRIDLPMTMPGEHAFAFRILGHGLTVESAS